MVRVAWHAEVDGESRAIERPVVDGCRCGGSALFPYDSTHTLLAAGARTDRPG